MSRKIFKLSGIVIDKHDRGEKDVIFTILTPEEGKIDVLAKHAKKVPSRHNSGLEIFNMVHCQLYQGKYVPVVDQSAQIEGFANLLTSYSKVSAGYAILVLLKKLVAPHQQIKQLYDFVYKTLFVLNAMDDTYNNMIIATFTVKLLIMLGFLNLPNQCDHCNELFINTIHYENNKMLCDTCCHGSYLHFPIQAYQQAQSYAQKTYEDILQKRDNTEKQSLSLLFSAFIDQII